MDVTQIVRDLATLSPFVDALSHCLVPVAVVAVFWLLRDPISDLLQRVRDAQGFGVSVKADPKVERQIEEVAHSTATAVAKLQASSELKVEGSVIPSVSPAETPNSLLTENEKSFVSLENRILDEAKTSPQIAQLRLKYELERQADRILQILRAPYRDFPLFPGSEDSYQSIVEDLCQKTNLPANVCSLIDAYIKGVIRLEGLRVQLEATPIPDNSQTRLITLGLNQYQLGQMIEERLRSARAGGAQE